MFHSTAGRVEPAFETQVKAVMARGVKLDQRKVVKLENAAPEIEGVYVHLKDAHGNVERVPFGFLVHKPETTLNAEHLIEQLGVEVVPGIFGNVIKTHPMVMATNVLGVFAAGDSMNSMTHVTTAMSSAIGAAGGLVHYLNEKDDEDALAAIGKKDVSVDVQKVGDSGCGTDA